MESERENTRDQTEGSGQQQPLGQQDEKETGQAGQQPQGQQQGQQPLGQERKFGTHEPATGQDLGDSGDEGNFVGSQGEESGEYLQQSGNPESGFADQGRGAPNQGSDIERDGERSENRDSDIEGSSGNS